MVTNHDAPVIDFHAEYEEQNREETLMAEVMFVLLVHKKWWKPGSGGNEDTSGRAIFCTMRIEI